MHVCVHRLVCGQLFCFCSQPIVVCSNSQHPKIDCVFVVPMVVLSVDFCAARCENIYNIVIVSDDVDDDAIALTARTGADR